MSELRGKGTGSIYHVKDGRWVGAFSYQKDGKRVREIVYARTRPDVERKLEVKMASSQPFKKILAAQSRKALKGTGVVYFIADRERSVAKIGFSANVQVRFYDLQVGYPGKLELIAHRQGSMRDEQALHTIFRHSRVRGEWFTLTPALETFMRQFCD